MPWPRASSRPIFYGLGLGIGIESLSLGLDSCDDHYPQTQSATTAAEVKLKAVWPPGSANTVCPHPSVTLTFDRFTLKLVCESHPRWGTFIPNLGSLGFWVLKLFAMYATGGQTKATLIAPSL